MIATGTFEVTLTNEPPLDASDGISIARTRVDKTFRGALEASSQGHMTGVRTPVDGSAGYVAIERVNGTLAGKRGSFVLQHSGSMARGAMSLSVGVVPDSGTGDLKGISGRMEIRIVEGKHFYDFHYDFAAGAP